MKKAIIDLLKKLLPTKLYLIVVNKPRLKIVDHKTARTSKWIWRMVLQGDHHRDNCDLYLKRKFTHIVDKGLQNLDRVQGRGGVIAAQLSDLNANFNSSDNVLEGWSNKIEKDYYSFQSSGELPSSYDPPYINATVSTLDLISTIKSRRSIRFFQNTEITDSDLEVIFSVLNWAPNSCNRQAIKVTVVSANPKKIKLLMKLNSGATCMNVPPVFACISYDSRGLILPTEREVAYVDAGLGLQNSILVAHSLGIGTCVLNWTHAKPCEEKELKDILSLDEHHIIVSNMVMGYPKKGALEPPRSDVKNFMNKV